MTKHLARLGSIAIAAAAVEHAVAASNRAKDQGHVDTGQHGHLGHLHR